MDIFWANQDQSLPAPRKFAIIAGFPQKYLIQNETHLSTLKDTPRSYTRLLVRMKTRGGRAVINARRAKGRKRLAA